MFNPNLPNFPQPVASVNETPKQVSKQELLRQQIIEKAGGKQALGQTRYLLNSYKQTLSLTDQQKEIGLGIVLGDANLQTQDQGRSYRLRYEGGNKHKSYVFSIHQDFDEWCLADPSEKKRIHPETKTEITNWEFQTLSHPDINFFADLFLDQKGKKRVPENILNHPNFTSRSLAYWIMDDGSKMDHTSNQGKGVEIHTEAFSETEVKSLCQGLQKKYNLKCWPKTKQRKTKQGDVKTYHIVAISGESYEQLMSLITPYMHKEMYHKLPTPRKRT